METTTSRLLAGAGSFFVLYIFTVALYRKFFHPLAKFPAPPLAAISSLELRRIYRKGFPERDFEHWHRHYDSKIIRIAPNEVHVADSETYKSIYNQRGPPKYDVFFDGFLVPGSLFAMSNVEQHKERRKAMNPLFSKSSISRFSPFVLERLAATSHKISERCKMGPINIVDAVRCLTIDIISASCFGKTLDLTNQSPPSFRADYLRVFDIAVEAQARIFSSPLKRHIWPRLPFWLTKYFDESVRETIGLVNYAAMCLQIHNERTEEPQFPVLSDRLADRPGKDQIFEAIATLIGGSDTTALTVCIGTYNLLKNPKMKAKLEEGLREHIADPDQMPPLGDMEDLPCLTACMKESLRVAMPVPGRLPRRIPADGQSLIVDGQVIPPGTIVGCSAYSVHYDEAIWGPDAGEFKPERWLPDDAKHLDNYMVTLGKGSRQCIGINLAQAEVMLVLAHIFRKYDMELLAEQLEIRDVFVTAIPEEGVKVNFKPRKL